MSDILIDKLDDLPPVLSCEQLRCRYFTGKGLRVPDKGGKTKMLYRTGVSTEVGDIEVGVWCEAVKRMVAQNGEQAIYNTLLEWGDLRTPYAKTRAEKERYALELYSHRIWEEPRWVGYQEFGDMMKRRKSDE